MYFGIGAAIFVVIYLLAKLIFGPPPPQPSSISQGNYVQDAKVLSSPIPTPCSCLLLSPSPPRSLSLSLSVEQEPRLL